MDNNLTPERIQAFWEKCGFKRKEWANYPQHFYWEDPFGHLSSEYNGECLPPIDLNNLFRWAVPVVIGKLMEQIGVTECKARHLLITMWETKLSKGQSYEASLFEVCEEVLNARQ